MGISTTNWNAGRQMLQDMQAEKTNALLDEQRTLSVAAERDRQAQVARERESLEAGRVRMRADLESARGAQGADLSQYGLATPDTAAPGAPNQAMAEMIRNNLATLDGPGVTGQTLASMRDAVSKAKMQDTLGRVYDSVRTMKDEDFANFAKKYSDHSGQEWKFETDPKNGTTKIVLGDRALGAADRDQVARLVQAQVLRSSGYMDEAMNMTKGVLTEMRDGRKESLDTATKVATSQNSSLATAANLNQSKAAVNASNISAALHGEQLKRARKEGERKDAAIDAGLALFKEDHPDATPVRLEAVRTGAIPAVPKEDSSAPAEVKLAKAYIQAGLAKDMAGALKLATQSKSDSPEKVSAEIYGKALVANRGDAAAAQEATDKAMGYLFPPQAVKSVAEFSSPDDALAAAKAGKIKPGDKVTIGGRTATYQP